MGLVTRRCRWFGTKVTRCYGWCSGWCSGWCGTKGWLLTALLVGCIVVSLIAAKWMTPTQKDQDYLQIVVQSSLIVIFCVGILGMLILSICAGDNFSEDGHNGNNEKGTNDNNVDFLHRLQLLLLGIFAMGSVGHDVLKIVDILQCLPNSKKTSLAYEFIKLGFELGQIYFIAHFWTYRCKNNITRFILGLIFAANLCIWFYVLVSETVVNWDHKSKNTDHNYIYSSDRTCENGTTATSEMLESWQPYLYPLTMEFCLMASGLLGSMWGWNLKEITVFNDRSPSPSPASVVSQSGTAQPSQVDETENQKNNDKSEGHKETSYLDNLCDCWKKQSDNNKSVNNKNNEKEKILDNKNDKKGCCCKLPNCNKGKRRTCPEFFYVATLLSIILFVFAAANQDGLWEGYCCTYMVLHLVLLLCSLIVCCLMKKDETKPEQFGPDQILLLVSAGALILLTLLELIPPLANISKLDEKCQKYLIATDFFLLISVFFQTLILLKGWTKTYFCNPLLQRLFSIIAVLNLYMWFEDSIYAHQLDSKLYVIHQEFYDKMVWTLCKLILMPPCIFYRIHVAEMFGERFFML